MGVDPARFTLRELFLMVEGHRRDQWEHTAVLRCEIHNAKWFESLLHFAEAYPFEVEQDEQDDEPTAIELRQMKADWSGLSH